MKHLTILALALAAGLALAVPSHAAESFSAGKWDDETLDIFAALPVQEGGRNKPLDTVAQFKLLRLNGMRTFYPTTLGTGEKIKRRFTREPIPKLTPLEWMLDCLFFPEAAREYKNFLVDNTEIVSALGVDLDKKLRDRYSYNELESAIPKLFELAQQYTAIEEANRTSTQQQIVVLANNVFEFQSLISYLDFTELEFDTGDSFLLTRLFEEDQKVHLSDVLAKGPQIVQLLVTLRDHGDQIAEQAKIDEEMDRLTSFFQPLDYVANTAVALDLIPPANAEEKEWHSASDLVSETFQEGGAAEVEITMLASLERLVGARENTLAFKEELKNFRDLVVGQAEQRGEYGKIPLEVSFYRAKYFFYAQWLFVLSFFLAALSWLSLKNKWLPRLTVFFVSVPWVLLVVGITYRCIIRSRPPISTLYETILFITATVVIVSLFMEWINRQRIALSVAAFLGMAGMFLANKYEMSDKQDTMPSLVAVLDTNFWLSTHVTIVTAGYAAGLLAAAISHIYIITKLLNIRKSQPAFFRNITRMVYGIVCFGLFCSFIGTVLGGIWANYSWGRFWGWDPKENGALMIVLWNLAIIHARFGGMIKATGIHMASIFGGMIVAFSWWGVNNLGVGLHSYGFVSGIWNALYLFWAIESAFLLLGCALLIRDAAGKKGAPPSDAVPVGK